MIYLLLVLICNFSCVHTMDVDEAPVPKKKRARSDSTEYRDEGVERVATSSMTSSTTASIAAINIPTSSNSSSVSSNYIVLTDEQIKISKWVMQEMTEQNKLLEEHVNLTYPAGASLAMRKNQRERILAQAKDVAENRDILEQNKLKQLANWAALQHHGMSESEFSGDILQQKKRLQQVQDDITRLFEINDHVVRCCKEAPTPESTQPARKKQKRVKGDQ